jgi:hypothetical protein
VLVGVSIPVCECFRRGFGSFSAFVVGVPGGLVGSVVVEALCFFQSDEFLSLSSKVEVAGFPIVFCVGLVVAEDFVLW